MNTISNCEGNKPAKRNQMIIVNDLNQIIKVEYKSKSKTLLTKGQDQEACQYIKLETLMDFVIVVLRKDV